MSYRALHITAFFILFAGVISAREETETRSYSKSFRVGKESSLEVTNKYGTVQVTTWSKDSVSIRAEIKASAPSQEKLKPMFEGLSVSITSSGQAIRAQTVFGQNFNRIIENFKGMTSKIISYDSKVEINYYLKVPEYLNLKIENKYGDLYMEDCTGKVTIIASNGSCKAGSLNGENEIDLSFCNAEFKEIGTGNINASFSEVDADKIGTVTLESISSEYIIGSSASLRVESRRDKFQIEKAGVVTGDSYFTDFNIKNLDKEITLSSRYGKIEVERIAAGFESVNLSSGYMEISLKFDDNSSYSFDIRHFNTFLSLPSGGVRSEEKTLNEEKKEYVTFGTFGNGQGKSRIKIDATRGKIYIR